MADVEPKGVLGCMSAVLVMFIVLPCTYIIWFWVLWTMEAPAAIWVLYWVAFPAAMIVHMLGALIKLLSK